jgi:23S rRNA (guanosine2251-2'-O)-methyltransferase
MRQQIKRNNLICGIHPIEEAVRSGKQIDKVLIDRELNSEAIKNLKSLLKENHIAFNLVPAMKLNGLTRLVHQGVVAFTSPISFGNFEEAFMSQVEQGKTPFLILLDRITDVRNFGAICRSAECFGSTLVVIPEQGAASINEDALKASAGALMHVEVCKVKNLLDAMDYLHASGVQTIVLSEKATETIFETAQRLEPETGICLIMGNEEEGVQPGIFKRALHQTRIPMVGKTDSLNVSVAAGIALHAFMR